MGEKGNALPSETRMEESNDALMGVSTTRALHADPTGDPTGGPGIADQAAGGGLTSYRARDPDQPGISIVAYEWDLNNDRSGELAPEQAKRDREVGG